MAAVAAGLLLTLALGAAVWLGVAFLLHAAGYIALQLAYSFALKRQVILDVLSIALGFVIRASAGGAAVQVPVSQWLLVCTILLALFLALAKRRHEITLLGEDASRFDRALESLEGAWEIGPDAPPTSPLVLQRISA